MSSRKKILLIALQSFLFLGLGSYYLYREYSDTPENRAEAYIMALQSYSSEEAVSSIDLIHARLAKEKFRMKHYEEKALLDQLSDGERYTDGGSFSGKSSSSGRGVYPVSPSRSNSYWPGLGSGGSSSGSLLAVSGKRGMSSSSPGIPSIGGGADNRLTVPFGAPQSGAGGGVLIDPTPDDEMKRINVGEGIWILLLLLAGYAFVPIRYAHGSETVNRRKGS